MHKSTFRIFASLDSRQIFESKKQEIERIINNETEDYLNGIDSNEYIDHLESKFFLEIPELNFDEVFATSYEKEVEGRRFPGSYDVSSNNKYKKEVIVYHVPYSGNGEIFKYQPHSQFILWSVDTYIKDSALCFEFMSFNSNPVEDIKNKYSNLVSHINSQFANLKSDINSFNSTLDGFIRSKLNKRISKIQQKNVLLGSLGVKIKENPPRNQASESKIKSKPKPQPKIMEEMDENDITVFISYSWDSEDHKKWVVKLATDLADNGINIILDQFELRPGKSLNHFVENSISKADRVLIVFTENYKMKADDRKGGVGYEYSIMNAELYRNQTNNEKIIPLLRSGNSEKSIPTFMQQYIHLDMSNPDGYNDQFDELIRVIYDEPKLTKPKVGKKPKL